MNRPSCRHVLLALAVAASACSQSTRLGSDLPFDPASLVSEVTLDRTTGVLANGTDSAVLTVTLAANQKPISGVTVSVAVSGSGNAIGPNASTDATGTTRVTLASVAAGAKTVTVTATAQGTSIVLPTQPTLDFVGVALAASSSSQPADGNSAAGLTVTMQDTKGVGVAGVSLTLSASGSNNLIRSVYGTTDANGLFKTTLVSTQAEAKTITVTAATMTATATATFTASTACLATLKLPTAPWVGLHHPSSYTVADFNRDSIPDAVVTSILDETSSTHLGRGDGTFSQAVTNTLDHNTVFLVNADFNGDKRPDVAGISNGAPSSTLYVAMGNGDGTFAAATYYTVDPNAQAIVVDDFDHNASPDLAVYGTDNHVAVYLNGGSNGFSAAHTTSLYLTPTALVTGNFNGDSSPDIAFTNAMDANLQVLLGDGQGAFTVGPATIVSFTGASYLSTGLLDGDAQTDIVVGFQNIFSLRVLLGRPDGTFLPTNGVQTGFGLSELAIGDLNHDTFADILTVPFPPYTTTLATAFLGSGDGNFVLAPQSYGIPYDLSGVTFADINSDQLSDLIGFDAGNASLITITAQPGRAFPSYGWSASTPTLSTQAGALLVADFNGDGNKDLLVTTANANALIFSGLGDGNFTAASNANVGPNTGLSAVADFNGDNIADIAVAGNGNYVAIVLGHGDGTFGQAYNANTLSAPVGIVAAKFNGDKYADIAVSLNTQSYPVNVLVNAGDGNFLPPVQVYANPGTALVQGDFTGDGNVDLMLGDQTNNNLSLMVGAGDGTFGQGTGVRTGGASSTSQALLKLASGDFNGDGKLDIVATGGVPSLGSSPSVTVCLNAGNGTFTAAPAFGNFTSTAPAAVGVPTVADINGDNVLDIVISNAGNSVLKVYLGRGNGTFQASLEYGWGHAGIFTTAIGDFNKDGRADVAGLGQSQAQVVLAAPCLVSSPTYFDRAGCAAVNPDAILVALLAGGFALTRRCGTLRRRARPG